MTSSPVISVIVLAHNRPVYLERCIHSIMSQTFSDFELILINNGSDDNGSTATVCEKLCYEFKDVRFICRENSNIGAGRNAGINAARGEWITFVDDDDWVKKDFLEFMYSLAIENDADVAISGATDKAFDEKIVMTAEEALIELMRRKRYNMAFPTKLFQRILVEDLRFPEDKVFDDIGLMYKLLGKSHKVVYHGLPKYTFYRHDGNNSAWTTNHSLLTNEILGEYLFQYQQRRKWLSEKFPSKVEMWQYFEWSFMISMVEKIKRYNIENCNELLEFMLCELIRNRDEFLNSAYTQDFEKEWVKQYV